MPFFAFLFTPIDNSGINYSNKCAMAESLLFQWVRHCLPVFALARATELFEEGRMWIYRECCLFLIHSWRVALPTEAGFTSDNPPIHNNVMSRSRWWANCNDIQIGNCTCLALSYCFMVNMCNNVHGRRGQFIRESLFGSKQDCGFLFSVSNKKEKV